MKRPRAGTPRPALHGPSACRALERTLAADCGACCGLCCVAVAFAAGEGFPADKPAGKPCEYLTAEDRCAVHDSLGPRGLHGCAAYDCFGAGQYVTREVYGGRGWRSPEIDAGEMFGAFLTVQRLHQMLWYLAEAAALEPAAPLRAETGARVAELLELLRLPAPKLAALDAAPCKRRVNVLLHRVWEEVRRAAGGPDARPGGGFAGKDLRGARLTGRDFGMAVLIAADLRGCRLYGTNLIGADLRGADLRDADLRECVFLTQGQLGAARGNGGTLLPERLTRPAGWEQ